MDKEFETIIEPLDWPSEWDNFVTVVEQLRKRIERELMLPLSLLKGEGQWTRTLILQKLKLEIGLDFLIAAYCTK